MMANFMLVSYLKTVLRCRHPFSHNELISAGHFWAKKNMHYSRVIKIFFVSKSFKTYGGLTPLTSRISIPSFVVLRCRAAAQRCLKVFKNSAKGVPQGNFSISSKFKSPPEPPDMMANVMLVSYLKTVLCCRHPFSHNELISAGHFWAKKICHTAG